MTSSTPQIGDRVRVLPVGSHGKIYAGRIGTVVEYPVDLGPAPYRETFPVAVKIDGFGNLSVWRLDELEVIEPSA